MASEISRRIDEVIRSGVAPLMKQEGFTRSARTFHRRVGNTWLVVNIQASQENLGDHGRFYVNVGVYFPEVDLLQTGRTRDKPKEYECALRNRVGEQWDIDPATDLQALAVEVATAIRDVGLAWLIAHSDIRQVAHALRDQASFMSATLALAIGDRTEARRRLLQMMQERPARAPNIKAWAKDQGLDVEVT
jgi:hypothetical protein